MFVIGLFGFGRIHGTVKSRVTRIVTKIHNFLAGKVPLLYGLEQTICKINGQTELRLKSIGGAQAPAKAKL
jgi:hypothetical protein